MVLLFVKVLIFLALQNLEALIALNPHIRLEACRSITFWLLLPLLSGVFWLTSLM
ncbi:hypothetical protein COO91_09204 (plasmid) [Nostoc flagelliforme CCNUN1]|uniref:Uncharacterized protein n=1 Tax=Nostoc flagelliforme CCNUN1 TaxID=2038116 RepID=A0A2K8T5Q7_9NOSO|nr:hypothetical protein COO91_09204 [Nostoc flagelliforme CCNUN1]